MLSRFRCGLSLVEVLLAAVIILVTLTGSPSWPR